MTIENRLTLLYNQLRYILPFEIKSPVQRIHVHLNTWRGGITVVVIAENTLQGSSTPSIQHITKLRSLPIYSHIQLGIFGRNSMAVLLPRSLYITHGIGQGGLNLTGDTISSITINSVPLKKPYSGRLQESTKYFTPHQSIVSLKDNHILKCTCSWAQNGCHSPVYTLQTLYKVSQ